MLEGLGHWYRSDGKIYIYLPADIVKDSTFPLHGKKGDVKVRIEKGGLRIEKANGDK